MPSIKGNMARPKGIQEIKPRETLKRQKLARAVIKEVTSDKPNKKSYHQLAKEQGYTEARGEYSQTTREYIRLALENEGLGLDDCKKRFDLLYRIAVKGKDYKEARANNENITRMAGGFKDKVEQTNITKDSLYDEYQRFKQNRLPDIVKDNQEQP